MDMKGIQSGKKADEKARKDSGVHLWLVLMKAFHSISEFAAQTLGDSGLGDTDFQVLEALLHKGPLPVNTLGPKVFLTAGSISTAVERLHTRGLVSRTDSTEDRRVRVVALTPAGRKLIEGVFAAHAQQMEELTAVLSPKERQQITEGLKRLGKQAEGRSR